jgi:hypothetical protein
LTDFKGPFYTGHSQAILLMKEERNLKALIERKWKGKGREKEGRNYLKVERKKNERNENRNDNRKRTERR